jgi:Na+/H+ antiporter NhaD/arsenite permease-like protein
LARLARLSLGLIVLMVLAKVALVWAGAPWELRLSWIALAGALPVLVASPRRIRLLKRIDWPTLLFFAAMFVLTACVWQTGFLHQSIERLDLDLTQPGSILGVGVLLSQLVSNVPLRRGTDLSFLQFARVGLPLTALHVAIYWLFLSS